MNKKVRILFVINSLRTGGKEKRFIELLKGISSKYSDIEFFIIVMDHEIQFEEVTRMNWPIAFAQRKYSKIFNSVKTFNTVLGTFKPHLVHCWDTIASLYYAPICKIKGIPFVNSMISFAPDNISRFSNLYIIVKTSFLFSDYIISNSKAGLDNFNAPFRKSISIHNGYNFERINNLPSIELIKTKFNINGQYVVGMVASFTKLKDHKTFIEGGIEVLKRINNISFVLVGGGPELEHHRNSIPELYRNNFIFTGQQNCPEAIIQCFDIGILCTYSEGISNSIMEYMALGKPVIASKGGGTTELVIDGETGFVIESKNTQSLTEKLTFLLSNLPTAKEMGKKGNERILKYFSLERMVTETYKIYEKVLA